jgi:DNA-binding MarR family transcriptional regulator
MSRRLRRVAGQAKRDSEHALADSLHRSAIGLLRGIRNADQVSGVSPARLSALSVLVFAGPQSLASLALAEGVRPPTMSRLVAELEREGFVEKSPAPGDRRGLVISATPRGRKVMLQGRDRRLALLNERLAGLSRAEVAQLEAAAPALLKLAATPKKPIKE